MKNRPWIWVIVAHLLLVAALTVTIIVCQRNAPQPVPLVNSPRPFLETDVRKSEIPALPTPAGISEPTFENRFR